MKTKYQHIHFVECKTGGIAYKMHKNKTGDIMADVYYYGRWKKFVVDFDYGFIFDNDCQRDIADFLDQLDDKRQS